MRLFELLEDSATPAEIKKIQQALNQAMFSPSGDLQQGNPVLDLSLPVEKSNGLPAHFFQRAWEREISAVDILKALKKGYKKVEQDKDYLAHEEGAEGKNIDMFDPETNILIPTIVQANPLCSNHPEEEPVCTSDIGPQPKHQIIAKTIIQKGEPNKRDWPAGQSIRRVLQK